MAQTTSESELLIRIGRAMEQERFTEAQLIAAELTEAPSSPRVRLLAADRLLRSGDAKAAVEQFDFYADLRPEQGPYLWQRGIALYFVGRFEDGVEQFKIHREVNSKDVENAAWHFLCLAKLESPEKARQLVLPAPDDPRPTMKEILEMLRTGNTSNVSDRMKECEGQPDEGVAAFYGNFYLGLHADALGQRKEATKFMGRAAAKAPMGYMGDIARVYLEFLESQT
ncbi:MAG: tetratricopeptide repeat protein [Planctomycetota bacterium]